jgi:hypothetical protein
MITMREYPPRLSVDELRGELDDYLAYRRASGRVAETTVDVDRSHIGQFLGWLETGRAGRLDYAAMGRELLAEMRRDTG